MREVSAASIARQRVTPTLEWETRFGYPLAAVAGVDEVGRGCLAGPVVAAAVILPPKINHEADPWVSEITDSKRLPSEGREQLAPLIRAWALGFSLGCASAEEIDQINIFHASHLAMKRAIAGLSVAPVHLLIDGKFLPQELSCAATAVIQGDLKCLSIAAASILAKVWRDHHMAGLETKFPGYGFGVHKGYPTPAHREALLKKGVCSEHRRSFGPVRALL